MPSVYQPADKSRLYVRYKVNGKWKSSATPYLPGQEQEAEALGLRLEREAQAPGAPPPKLTVHAWAERWLRDRSERVRDHVNDESRLALHVLPGIGHMLLEEVRPAHLVVMVEDWKKKDLAPRTIRNVYSVIRAMWRDARLMDLVVTDPCILTSRQLGVLRDKDLGWRDQAVFSRDEVLTLLMDTRVPLHRRVLYGLLLVGMLRDGEACGLRWGRVHLRHQPLGRLVIATSYDNDITKTERERWMPIHPGLGVLLEVWRAKGWGEEMGRSPTDADLVVPAPRPTNRGRRVEWGAMLSKDWVWKRVQKDLATLGFRPRRAHDMRRTGISLARSDGADKDILRRGTHAPPKEVMDLYTTYEWERLCDEVMKLRLERLEPKRYGPRVRRVKMV